MATALTTTAPATVSHPDDPRAGHRRDIDGLRGVAVAVVVAFHAGLPGVSGGFVGVDVFFAISGYLITGLIVREVEEADRVRLGRFWARRIRRLVPALAVVLVATTIVFVLFTSPLEWRGLARDAGASAVYVSNVVFARSAVNYFDDGLAVSPFLHTWSLSVEEQFYVVWPLLLGAVAWIARRWRARTALVLGATLTAVAVGSFAVSLWLSRRASPWAFFSMPTRAWEFAAAGLLAIAVRHATARSARWARDDGPARAGVAVAGALGLALIALAVVTFEQSMTYPGARALVPVAGTLLVIGAGSVRPVGVGRALGARPLRWLGANSYAWYLWHWPLIVLVPILWPTAGLGATVAAAVAALLLADLTRRVIEDPRRFRVPFTVTTRGSWITGAALTATTLVIAGLVAFGAHRSATDPFLATVSAAREDFRLPLPADCDGADPKEPAAVCAVGDVAASQTIVLVGDSHAQQWIAPLDAIGRARHVRVVLRTFGGCPAVDVAVIDPKSGAPSSSCARYRAATHRLLTELHPAAVALASAGFVYRAQMLDDRGERLATNQVWRTWTDATRALVADVEAAGGRAGVILDTPSFPTDPIECLARARTLDACAQPAWAALETVADSHAAERAAASAGTVLFDPVPLLCGPDTCPVTADGAIRYKDNGHLTTNEALRLRGPLDDFVAQLLR